MMKALTLEEMVKVNGGELSTWRKIILAADVVEGQVHGYSLQQIQDMCCDNDEERAYVKEVWDYFYGG